MYEALVIALAYLLGCFCTGYYLVRVLKGGYTRFGSGNVCELWFSISCRHGSVCPSEQHSHGIATELITKCFTVHDVRVGASYDCYCSAIQNILSFTGTVVNQFHIPMICDIGRVIVAHSAFTREALFVTFQYRHPVLLVSRISQARVFTNHVRS